MHCKKLLVENGAATPADKQAINEGIDELIWVAALKPNNIGVPAYRDDSREYLEIAILSLRCRAEARSNRITELIHRSIPYPVLLVSIVEIGQEENEISRKTSTASAPLLNVSVADKRFSQKDAQSMVLEDGVTEVQIEADSRLEGFKPDRSDDEMLYELLLKLGLDLCVPIEQRTIANKVVHSIGAGALIVCLATKISRDDAEPLALGIVEWHKQQNPAGDTTIVFRDSAFGDDVTKTNVTAILQQHGLENVRSL